MSKLLSSSALTLVILAAPAIAEVEVSLYLGAQSVQESDVSGVINRSIDWEGRSDESPPYYGGRITWWQPSGWGWGIELTHTKAYASDEDLAALGFSSLEFSDGHNILTVNVHRRWEGIWANGKITPYVLAGVGVAIPHVDATPIGDTSTFGYQLTGPAVRLGAGAQYALNDRWGLFAEYQFTYSDNDVDLDSGGSFDTEIVTNAINVGVSYSF